MTPAQRIALWADKLRDLSALGLRFADSGYDRERYRAIQDVALDMLALATGDSMEDLEPLRAPMFSRPTPLNAGDGAVINDEGQILLIRRADNGLWAMPGGALEVGETPAEGVVREVREETGVQSRPVALVGVFDSRLCGTVSRHHLYHFVFLCRPLNARQPAQATHSHEVLDVRWFAEDGLPDDFSPGHASRIRVAFRVWRGGAPAFFDGRAGSANSLGK